MRGAGGFGIRSTHAPLRVIGSEITGFELAGVFGVAHSLSGGRLRIELGVRETLVALLHRRADAISA